MTAAVSAYLDGSGCVNDTGLRVLSGALPGLAPSEITTHLAACARCQTRYLQQEAAREWPNQKKTPAIDPKRMRGLAILMLGALLLFLATLIVMLRTIRG